MVLLKNNPKELGGRQTFLKNYRELDYWSQKKLFAGLGLLITFCIPLLLIIFLLIKGFLMIAFTSNISY